ncbi:hypothetical protein CHS0354_029119 [Potamilus streckersoni]|uniref:Major facilitator superfamily (MFS) profile domain-containing protein n=1 Tax=Potamilus streckersoni TaxID=2493646 RepID=A0AAE0W320_9BIVA|nr:hypothetical protein CHS0354_029119 [Potamilus streckersoni]
MAIYVSCGRHSFDLKRITVEPLMFLYMFTTFFNILTLQDLVFQKVCYDKYDTYTCKQLHNTSYKNVEDDVQKATSRWILYINVAMGIPALFVLLFFMGPICDRVSRKLPLIIPLIGSLLSTVNNLVNSVYMSAPVGYLLIGSAINGLTGGYLAMIMAIFSYISYISSPEYKTIKLGITEAMTFLSGALGTLLSGVILDSTSFVFVFGLLAGILLLALVYTIFWVDDIKPSIDPQHEPAVLKTFVTESVKETWVFVYQTWKNSRRKLSYIAVSCVVLMLLMVTLVGQADIMLLYTKYEPFDWSQTTLGMFNAVETFLRGLAVLTVLPILKRIYHQRDTILALIGLVSKIVSLLLIGIGKYTWIVFLGAVVGVFQGFPSAALRSIMSSSVQQNEQGKLFSIIGALEAVATLCATLIFNNLYSATLTFYSGFPFFVGAVVIAVGFFLTLWVHRKIDPKQRYHTLEEPHDEEVVEPAVEVQPQSQTMNHINPEDGNI